MMHNTEEGMSWRCKTHLELNDIQPASIYFAPFKWHWCTWSSEDAQWTMVILGSSVWKWSSADLSVGSDNRLVSVCSGHRGRPPRTEQRGRLLWYSWRSQTPWWLSTHPSVTEKAATWRRNHYSFNHLSYSAEHTLIQTRTHTRTQTSTLELGRSPKADFSDNQSEE